MIGLYEKCGQAFKNRYLECKIIPPQAALTVGKSVDTGITYNLSQKITSGQDLAIEEVVDVTTTEFDKSASETDWQDEDPGRLKDVTVQLVKAQHSTFAPTIDPLIVQKTFSAKQENYILEGTVDLIEKDGTIVDHKTARAKYDENAVATSIQPAMYSLLLEKNFGVKADRFRYDVLVKPTKTIPVRTQRVQGIVSDQQKEFVKKRADSLYKAIQTGNFHYASDQAYWCSEKWCGYWNICEKGGKN
jgi:hypothetical protein